MTKYPVLLRGGKRGFSWQTLAFLVVVGWAAAAAAQATNELAAVIEQDGAVSLPGSAEVPPYSMTGKWIEVPGKSDDKYVTRHFLFMVPNQPPALELFLARDRSGARPDGVFENGLVRGYVSGFAGKARFQAADPVFEDCTIGSAKAKRCRVKLSRDQRTLWVYAYIYARQPSLTFISVRPDPDAQPTIERYLGALRLK